MLKDVLGLDAKDLHGIFTEWNQGELDSYLIEITADIFSKYDDETGKPMVDVILDTAGQKEQVNGQAKAPGSGRAAVHDHRIRILPFLVRNERRACGDKQNPEWSKSAFDGDKAEFIENVRKALFASKIVSYAQGFAQLRVASDEYGWNLQYGNLAKIWRGAHYPFRFLQNITDAYENNPELKNLAGSVLYRYY